MITLNKAIDKCNLVLAGAAGAFLGIMVVLVLFAMISRTFFGRPFGFLLEWTAYSMTYITFLSAPWMLQIGRHVKMDMVPDALPPHVQRWWLVALDLLVALISLVMFYVSAVLVMSFYADGITLMDQMRTPRWITLLPFPIGSFFLTVEALRHAIRRIVNKEGGGK